MSVKPSAPDHRPLIIGLESQINTWLSNSKYKNYQAGIAIQATSNRQLLYSNNASRLFIPASAVKVIPSAIALKKIGAEKVFTTPIRTDGKQEGHLLSGNLYLQGVGDVSLSTANLEQAAENIKKMGITVISGDLLFDVQLFDQKMPRYGNLARHLYTPASPLSVNYGWLELELIEEPEPALRLKEETRYAQLNYDIAISHSTHPGKPPMTFVAHPWGDAYTIEGTVTEWDKRYKYLRLASSRPGLMAATRFKEALAEQGVMLEGEIRQTSVSEDLRLLTTMQGRAFYRWIEILNQESNNFIAESVLKLLAANFMSVPGTRRKGLDVVRSSLIKDYGFATNDFQIADGSGLSYNNQLSPFQFVHFLQQIQKDKAIFPYFKKTLAKQGFHPHAMIPKPPEGISAWVKSGTLPNAGVNSLVGYIILEDINEVFSFALLFNPSPSLTTSERQTLTPIYSGTLTNPLTKVILEEMEKYQSLQRLNENRKETNH